MSELDREQTSGAQDEEFQMLRSTRTNIGAHFLIASCRFRFAEFRHAVRDEVLSGKLARRCANRTDKNPEPCARRFSTGSAALVGKRPL